MARGDFHPDGWTALVLSAPWLRQRRSTAAAALTGTVLLLLASCTNQQAAPTPVPAPTLPVVSATAGPPPVPTPGTQQAYIIREGDTLSAIAARFGVEEDAVVQANPGTEPDTLFVGQELIIPPAQP